MVEHKIERHDDGSLTLMSGLYRLVLNRTHDDGAVVMVVAPDMTVVIALTSEQLDALAETIA